MSFFRKPTTATPTRPESGPAISLDKVPPGLVSLAKTAAISLEKTGLTGQRAAVYLVLDRSGSMSPYYRDGTVQHLAEQTLALSANLDDDGAVPLVFFDTNAYRPIPISLDNYAGRIDHEHQQLGRMGTTNYAAAMQMVVDHYQTSGTTDPAFVIFQTDGSPDSRVAAERLLCKSSKRPIFWQFIGFGNDRFDFLRKLDELPVPQKRMVDNAGFFAAGRDPRAMNDGDLYDQLMAEYPQWLAAATAAGIVR